MSQSIGKCNNGIVTFGCNNLIHVFSNASLLDSGDRYITQKKIIKLWNIMINLDLSTNKIICGAKTIKIDSQLHASINFWHIISIQVMY